MEDESSFKGRVNKIFGSLSSSSSSAWSLSDDELQKKEWLRHHHHHDGDDGGDHDDDDDEQPTAPCDASSGLFGRNKKPRPNNNDDVGGDDDELEIRSSIGLDPTLDYEAEEDEYDKVAEGRENEGERLYMSAVTDHGPYLNSHNVLPDSVHDAVKDARANHVAAKARLEEDKAESLKFGNPLSRKVADRNKPKPALKMKDNLSSSKGQRRVRFDPYCKNKSEEGKPDNVSTGMPALQTTASDYQAWVKSSPPVPDYVLNPSKYTRYSFDSTSEVDNMDVLKSVKVLNSEEVPLGHPKFIPKKESGAMAMDYSSNLAEHKQDNSANHSGSARGIAAVEKETSDDMDAEGEEDMKKSEATKTVNPKPSRRYRPRPNLDDPLS